VGLVALMFGGTALGANVWMQPQLIRGAGHLLFLQLFADGQG
jgi:hypothetical protein